MRQELSAALPSSPWQSNVTDSCQQEQAELGIKGGSLFGGLGAGEIKARKQHRKKEQEQQIELLEQLETLQNEIHAEIHSMKHQAVDLVGPSRDRPTASLQRVRKVPNLPTLAQLQQQVVLDAVPSWLASTSVSVPPTARPSSPLRLHQPHHSARLGRSMALPVARSHSPPLKASHRVLQRSQTPQLSPRCLQEAPQSFSKFQSMSRVSQSANSARHSPSTSPLRTRSSQQHPMRLYSERTASPQHKATSAETAGEAETRNTSPKRPVQAPCRSKAEQSPAAFPHCLASPQRFSGHRLSPMRQSTPVEAHARPRRSPAQRYVPRNPGVGTSLHTGSAEHLSIFA